MRNQDNKAYLKLKRFVIKFFREKIKNNHNPYVFNKEILSDIISDKNLMLEWVLGEHFDDIYFKDLGIVVHSQWNKNGTAFSSIYKIGRSLIENKFTDGNYMIKHTYNFVKCKKIKTSSYIYEPINSI